MCVRSTSRRSCARQTMWLWSTRSLSIPLRPVVVTGRWRQCSTDVEFSVMYLFVFCSPFECRQPSAIVASTCAGREKCGIVFNMLEIDNCGGEQRADILEYSYQCIPSKTTNKRSHMCGYSYCCCCCSIIFEITKKSEEYSNSASVQLQHARNRRHRQRLHTIATLSEIQQDEQLHNNSPRWQGSHCEALFARHGLVVLWGFQVKLFLFSVQKSKKLEFIYIRCWIKDARRTFCESTTRSFAARATARDSSTSRA